MKNFVLFLAALVCLGFSIITSLVKTDFPPDPKEEVKAEPPKHEEIRYATTTSKDGNTKFIVMTLMKDCFLVDHCINTAMKDNPDFSLDHVDLKMDAHGFVKGIILKLKK